MRLFGAILCASAALAAQPGRIAIDYPAEGSIFPPDFAPPTFLWRDADRRNIAWRIDVTFADGRPALHTTSAGERLGLGEIDARCVAATNELPKLTARQAETRTWLPGAGFWQTLKERSVVSPAKVTITGFRDRSLRQPTSTGFVTIVTSQDPVGAPIFYRDVPLMPSELEKGVIKPLAPAAVPLIAWRLRNVGEPRSRVVLEGMHTCANCHSFSADGKTLGMDLDGPQNDKGLYAIASVQPRMVIRNEDVVSWKSLGEQPAGPMRVGFMSQISPDGRYVVTTVGVDQDLARNYYVANFKDYRFLQVFYATRGVLAWYDRGSRVRHSLPGADDPRYVQTNAVWSPDGKYLVFARAEAADPYPAGRKPAEYANDPNETPMRYDLYRIPFNGGQGGRAEPVTGASGNGKSNAFPKISPDGRWIVFVQARNGLLMRPDGRLYIVPASGGAAREMRCNTPLMNSWHGFSPNGRWLVFSSKARSPYTQMYLTHVDENGNDSPAILVENSVAANRAVNIPEFVNIAADGLARIDVPAVEFYTKFDRAWELGEKGRYQEAILEWQAALELSPDDARAHNNLAAALAREGRTDEAIAHWRRALAANGAYAEARQNLARALLALGFRQLRDGETDDAIRQLREAVALDPPRAEAHYNLGAALARKGQFEEAIAQYRMALDLDPKDAQAHSDLGVALLQRGGSDEAILHFRKAIGLKPGFAQAFFNLGSALYLRQEVTEALNQWRTGLRFDPDNLAALRQTAWALATNPEAGTRNGVEAVRLAERALKLSGTDEAVSLDILAAAYAESGEFPKAVRIARRAQAAARVRGQAQMAESLQERIALYATGRPFRASPATR